MHRTTPIKNKLLWGNLKKVVNECMSKRTEELFEHIKETGNKIWNLQTPEIFDGSLDRHRNILNPLKSA